MTLEEAKKAFPPIFVVYAFPRDYPHDVVVRTWYGVVPDPGEPLRFDYAEQAELYLWNRGLTRIDRDPVDDPCIIGSWI